MTRCTVHLAAHSGEEQWRPRARALDRALVAPADVDWIEAGAGQPDLLAGPATELPPPCEPSRHVSRRLVEFLSFVLMHADPVRFALAYRLLWRTRREPSLLEIAADADVARADSMARAVRRDMHKMKAFVRFRETTSEDGAPHYVAWFEPEHHIVAATAPFFARRFANMAWSILTPRASAHWDGTELTLAAGVPQSAAPDADRLEDVWRVYYASIFNPARLKVKAMTAEMPKKYWRNLPEASEIDGLIRAARARTHEMITAPALAARPTTPCAEDLPRSDGGEAPPSLPDLADAMGACRRCPLYRDATHAVPGEGPHRAALMIVGEQPGDLEDLAGRPFVAPAGKVLDEALDDAGVERSGVFMTNAVKHFKHEQRGKRRLHKAPSASEIDRCRWWLDREIGLVRPKLIVAMGASAARGVLGRPIAVGATRGTPIEREGAPPVLTTVHPSYLLRIRDRDGAAEERKRFVADLSLARRWLDAGAWRDEFRET